jgi:hypothetical protein
LEDILSGEGHNDGFHACGVGLYISFRSIQVQSRDLQTWLALRLKARSCLPWLQSTRILRLPLPSIKNVTIPGGASLSAKLLTKAKQPLPFQQGAGFTVKTYAAGERTDRADIVRATGVHAKGSG